MKSKLAAVVVVCALSLVCGTYFLIDASDTKHQGEAVLVPATPIPPPALQPKLSTSLSQALPMGTTARYAELKEQITPKEAHAIANAILNCNAVQFAGENVQQQSKLEDQIKSEAGCDQIKREFSIYDLAKYAAESGDTQAQLDFPALAAGAFDDEQNALDPELLNDYKKSSLSYLEQAAKKGEAEALPKLAESYASGRFSDADPKVAYAYAYAYARHSGSELAQKFAKKLSSKLSAEEITQAHQLARGM